jgi:beta-glucosidase
MFEEENKIPDPFTVSSRDATTTPSKPLIIDSPDLASVLPSTFIHGYASASYQIEGGYQSDGRGPSIWDEKLKGMENGDEAVNSYGLWKEDVELLKKYGATGYRFSVSWSRVIPLGEVIS